MSELEELNRMRFRICGRLPLNNPDCNDESVAEIKRLTERKIPNVMAVSPRLCAVCYSKRHHERYCPFLEKIPSKIKDIGPRYDRVCLKCGKIGSECCSVGSYAVQKRCVFCYKIGHWFWEERCPENYPLKIRTHWLWKCFKDGESIQRRPLQVPLHTTEEGFEEVSTLMKRTTCAAPVSEGCCGLCYAKGHPYYHCDYVESIPDGAVVGPDFDEVCAGCGKIGKRCCGAGAYPIDKWCKFCLSHGHWYWEDKHDFRGCPDPVYCRQLAEIFKTYMLKETVKACSCDLFTLIIQEVAMFL